MKGNEKGAAKKLTPGQIIGIAVLAVLELVVSAPLSPLLSVFIFSLEVEEAPPVCILGFGLAQPQNAKIIINKIKI